MFCCFFSFFNSPLEMSYLRMYWTDLHQIIRIGRAMGVDGQSDIHFVIAQGTLLWQPILGQSTKIGLAPFIHCTGIPEWIGGSQMLM